MRIGQELAHSQRVQALIMERDLAEIQEGLREVKKLLQHPRDNRVHALPGDAASEEKLHDIEEVSKHMTGV